MHLKVYFPNTFSTVLAIVVVVASLHHSRVDARPSASAQSSDQEGYNYQVPKNPLTLPERKTTTTTTTSTTTTTTIATTTTTQAATTEKTTDKTTTGYDIPIPKQPLTLPTKRTTTTATVTTITTPTATKPDAFVDDSAFDYYQYDGYDGSGDIYDYPESVLPTYSPDGTQDADDAEDLTDDYKYVEATSAKTGYNYPVPDNPLTLPTRRTTTPEYIAPASIETTTFTPSSSFPTTILSTSISVTSTPEDYEIDTTTENVVETTTGYVIDIPEEPLTLPTKPNIEITTTQKLIETTTSGYIINVPEDPLTLPPKPKTVTTTTDDPVESSTGYVISKPENPLTLPPRSEDLLDVLPPCTLLDIDENEEEERNDDYEPEGLKIDPFQIDIRSSDSFKRRIKRQARARRSEKRIPGVTCKLLPPCTTNDVTGQQPGIDCTLDYSIYDYGSFEYLDYPNEDRSFDGNSKNIVEVDNSDDVNSDTTKVVGNPILTLDPPPLTTSKPSPAKISTTTSSRSTGVASSDVLFRPLEQQPNKSHNIVMTCLNMMLRGEEPLEGLNCINQALTDEFDTFNFTTSIPETTIADKLEITTVPSSSVDTTTSITSTTAAIKTTSSKGSVTPAKPPAIFLTCNELFLSGQTPRPGVNCIHTAVTLDYFDDSEYSETDNLIEDDKDEEKLNKLLRNMQPGMPIDMMLLNERAMQAMLNDVNQVDYDIPGDGNLFEEKDNLAHETIVLSRDDSSKEKKNPVKGVDFSFLDPPPKDLKVKFNSNLNLNLRKLAKQLKEITI